PWYGGNIVSGDLYFAQAADIIGTRGLSLVWTLLQYLFYLTLKEAIRLKKEKAWKAIGLFRPLWISIAILALTHSYGAIRYHQAAAKENSATKVRVGVPQGNVPLITYRHERPYIISRMLAQTENLVQEAAAAQKPLDLVVWP
ncbi:MAG TPA: hypothetical protein PLY93_14790, partial [Turneriella sp.]|nr:hypothetical protein [Turneriella sp.]